MSRYKRWFLSLFITYSVLLSIMPVVMLLSGPVPHLGWLGVWLTGLAPTSFFTGLFLRPRARTSSSLSTYWLLIAPGLLLAMSSALTAVLSGFATLGWLLYLHWYSRLERSTNTVLQIGQSLPEIHLHGPSGEPVGSRDWMGQTSLLIFYRGNWCPLCMAQIGEVAAQYRELSARGVKVRLISPQPEAQTQTLAQRFGVDFEFLVDTQLAAARRLNIHAEDGLPAGLEVQGYDTDTVMPTVVIVDADGIVRYCDLTDNYRVRPEPAEFLAELDRLQLQAQN
jgi:peroxiredoxin